MALNSVPHPSSSHLGNHLFSRSYRELKLGRNLCMDWKWEWVVTQDVFPGKADCQSKEGSETVFITAGLLLLPVTL